MTVHTIVAEPRPVEVDFGAAATGDVLVDVAREDGTVLTNDAVAAHQGSAGVYRYTLTANHVATVERLTVTFTATVAGVARVLTDYVEVAGGYYFTLPELRALPQMEDEVKYPDVDLERARAEAEDLIDRNCDTSFVARYRRERHQGQGGRVLVVDSWVLAVLSVTVDGVTVTDPITLSPHSVELDRAAGWPCTTTRGRNIEARLAGGYDPTPAEDLRRAAKWIARGYLVGNLRKGMPAQAITVTNETGTYQLGLPTLRYPTGDRSIDVILAGWAERTYIPGVG